MHVEVKHPLIGHKLTLVRDKTTGVKLFRELIGEITMFLAYEALRGIPTESIEVETPLAVAKGVRVKGEIVLVPILRAGVGMLDAVMDMVPNARVGFLGLYRDHETSLPVEYYAKLPPATPGAGTPGHARPAVLARPWPGLVGPGRPPQSACRRRKAGMSR